MIKGRKFWFFTDREIYRIINMYNSGLTCRDIGSIMNCDSTSIYYILKKSDVKIRTKSEACRKIKFNESFFDDINTEEKAYFLGLLFADGCNYEDKNCISLSLKESDGELIHYFSKALEYKGKILNVEMSKYKSRNSQNQTRIQLYSKHFSEKLSQLGCFKNKSLFLKYPKELKKEFEHHFIRGYFDGDGSIQKRNTNDGRLYIVSTKDFLQNILNVFKNICGTFSSIKNKGKIYSLEIGGRKNLKKLYNYLYKDSSLFLKRKKDIFESIIIY